MKVLGIILLGAVLFFVMLEMFGIAGVLGLIAGVLGLCVLVVVLWAVSVGVRALRGVRPPE
jgi:hypothetical protein